MSVSVHVGRTRRRRALSLRALAVAVVLTAASALFSIPTQAMVAVGQPVPVLGARTHLGQLGGEGWGLAHPRRIYNGGSPSGLVIRIHWKHWGANRAFGHGRTFLYRPGGGFFKRPGRIMLRAQRLGHCPRHTRFAYTHLAYRIARRPGEPVRGDWHPWGPLARQHLP